jgi:hypothetical protein
MSSWDLVETTGLLDDADIEIQSAEFGYDAVYASGEQLILILTGTSNQEGWEQFTTFLSIGKGWQTHDNGATVVGRDEFAKNSQYGHFIQGALDSGATAVLQSRGFPDKAAIWNGLKFHVKRIPVDYGGEIGSKNVLKPTAFLGESGKAEAPAAVADTGASQTSGPAANGSSAVLRAKIMALKGAPNHDAFIEEVLTKHPEVQQDAELFAAVVDPQGIYAG